MTQKAFSIYEILELILSYTDTRTILLSQRVCRTWNTHINNSSHLQEALFFKPVTYELPCGSERIRNPFIEESVWPWLTYSNNTYYNNDYDDPYARPEASWRRMLFQQPPTAHIGIIYYTYFWAKYPLYTRMRLDKPDDDCLRLEDIATTLDEEALVPYDQRLCVLWYEPCRYERDPLRIPAEVDEGVVPISTFLMDCDFDAFEERCSCPGSPKLHPFDHNLELEGVDTEFIRWLGSLGEMKSMKIITDGIFVTTTRISFSFYL